MSGWWAACRARSTGDEGSSVIEFLGLAVVLLIPLVYLVLTLARIEAATFATEGAAREAARTYVVADGSARAPNGRPPPWGSRCGTRVSTTSPRLR